MIFAKTTTFGLDTSIKELQTYLNDNLTDFWSGTINVYGRIYKNTKDGNIIPEAYIGTGANYKEYKQIFINDKEAATIGFNVISKDILPYKKANIDVVFALNLKYIFPSATTREDELAKIHAERVLNNFGVKILSIKEGIRNVLSEFNIDGIIYNDMHPFLVFAYNIDLNFEDDLDCKTLSVS